MKKKKILFQSDFSLGKTGFGRNARALLKYLYNTDKYEIVHYCCGSAYSEPFLKKTPWKSVGCLPDDENERNMLQRDPNMARRASYGEYLLNKVIKDEKPDVYIAVQDIWGVDFSISKPWFNKIHSVLWTTLDSLPILPTAIEAAKKVENFWIWSSFATNALHKLGYDQVKTVHGVVEPDCFRRLTDKKRLSLRKEQGIDEDAFIIGFVFRNQLRKSVPNLLEGYKKWLKRNTSVKNPKLLLHTHFGEGWNIVKLAKEYDVDIKDIITTLVCRACHRYIVKSFTGQDIDCPMCQAEKSMTTTNTGYGVTEEQLNEVYNLMDVYCHPFTSGGQEIPIQEAKLTELITLVTSYSCGEEMCCEEAHSLPLDWAEYREHGTEFIKASTNPNSIAKQLDKVYKMKPQKRREWGEKARGWVVDNFSPKVVGGFFEDFLDSLEEKDYDFDFSAEKKDPHYVIPEINDDAHWVLHMYAKILKMPEVDEEDEGFKYWMGQIDKGQTRGDIENYFRNVALKDNEQSEETPFESFLDKDDAGRRMVYVMPNGVGDVYASTSLFKSIKETYPDYNLYVSTTPNLAPLLDANPYVHKVIPFSEQMEDIRFLEGASSHKGFFEIAFSPYLSNRSLNHIHNAKDKLNYDLTY